MKCQMATTWRLLLMLKRLRTTTLPRLDPDAPRANQKVVGDKIVEFTPEGEIVWDWNTFDHLDIWRFGYLLTEVYWHTPGLPRSL